MPVLDEPPANNAGTADYPARVRNIFTEMFALTVSQGHRIDKETATAALAGTVARLGEICIDCLNAATAEKPAAAAKTGDDNRKYFLLRMVSCKLSHLFDTTNNPTPLDRACSHGIEAYMHRIFSDGVYQQLNARARDILKHTGDGDTRILNAILDHPDYRIFLENVLVRLAGSFIKYNGAKDSFISELNMAMPDNSRPLGHAEFKAIIRALLADIFLLGKTLGGNDLLDYRYGKNTAAIIDRVADDFGRDI